MHGLEQQWGGRIAFVYLDIDDPGNDGFKRQLGYVVQPHLILLDGQGAVLQQWYGLVEEGELEAALSNAAD